MEQKNNLLNPILIRALKDNRRYEQFKKLSKTINEYYYDKPAEFVFHLLYGHHEKIFQQILSTYNIDPLNLFHNWLKKQQLYNKYTKLISDCPQTKISKETILQDPIYYLSSSFDGGKTTKKAFLFWVNKQHEWAHYYLTTLNNIINGDII